MNTIGVEVSERVSAGPVSLSYQGQTCTHVGVGECVYGRVSRHGVWLPCMCGRVCCSRHAGMCV